jgi:hypothetical protein
MHMSTGEELSRIGGDQVVRPAGVSEINAGSSYDWLKYATGVLMGKYTPMGFDTAASMVSQDPGSVRPVHHFWLMVEGRLEGRDRDVQEDFGDTPRMAKYITDHFLRDHSNLVAIMLADLRAMPDVDISVRTESTHQIGDLAPLLIEGPK